MRALQAFLLSVLIATVALGQRVELYPNVVGHSSCSSLLTGRYTVTPEDITDFVTSGAIDLKLIQYDGILGPGIADNLSGLFIERQYHKLIFPNKSVGDAYRDFITGFLDKVDPDLSKNSNTTFICTFNSQGHEITTYFHIGKGKIVAYAHPVLVSDKQVFHLKALTSEVDYSLKNNKMLVWYGEDSKLPINETAKDKGCAVYRRVKSIDKDLPGKIASFDQVLSPETTVICNSVPSTKNELVIGGLPAAREKKWQDFKKEIGDATSAFTNAIHSPAELKKEIIDGNQNVVFIVAHLQESKLFIGGEAIALNDIQQWGKRLTGTSGNRVAVLVVCDAGNQNYKTGNLLWRKQTEPLSNILLNNHYFDVVIAPDHTIFRPEAVSVIQTMINSKSVAELQSIFKGWVPYVSIPKTKPNEKF